MNPSVTRRLSFLGALVLAATGSSCSAGGGEKSQVDLRPGELPGGGGGGGQNVDFGEELPRPGLDFGDDLGLRQRPDPAVEKRGEPPLLDRDRKLAIAIDAVEIAAADGRDERMPHRPPSGERFGHAQDRASGCAKTPDGARADLNFAA